MLIKTYLSYNLNLRWMKMEVNWNNLINSISFHLMQT